MNLEERVFISTSCVNSSGSYKEVIDTIINSSVKNIEISGNYFFLQNLDVEKLINEYQNNGINFTFHNYFPSPENEIVMNILSNKTDLYDASVNIIKNSFKLCKSTDVQVYGIHPGYFRDAKIDDDKNFKFVGNRISIESAYEYYSAKFIELHKILKHINDKVFFGLENLFPNHDNTNDSFMCTFDEINYLFNIPYLKNEKIGIILDLGHLNISANLLGFDKFNFLNKIVDLYSDKIYEIHISENLGTFDSHNEIKSNSWQLDVLNMFKDTGPKSQPTVFTLESRNLTASKILNSYQNIINSINK